MKKLVSVLLVFALAIGVIALTTGPVEAKKGQSYEIKMELKKRNLLGGPIQSNWK